MRLTDFEYSRESNVAALRRSLRNAKALTAEHTALIKLAFEYARAVDSLDFVNDDHNKIAKTTKAYREILTSLAIGYERAAARPAAVGESGNAERPDASPRLLKIEDFTQREAVGE